MTQTTTKTIYPCYCGGRVNNPFDPCGHGDTSEGCPKHDPEAREEYDAEEWDADLRIDPTTRFVFLVEGDLHLGTVVDYAEALQSAHYAGFEVDSTVWGFVDGKPVAFTPEIKSSGYDEDDYATTTVNIAGEEATFRIDGRA